MKVRKKMREGGQALVEFTLMLPILLLLLCGIIDFGWIYSNQLIVEFGTRDGARYGAINASSGSFQSMVETRVRSNTPVTDPLQLQINAIKSLPDISVEVTYEVPLLTPVASTILGDTFTVSSKCIMKAE